MAVDPNLSIDLIYQITTRASVDIDFSMVQDFPGGANELQRRVAAALKKAFRAQGYILGRLWLRIQAD